MSVQIMAPGANSSRASSERGVSSFRIGNGDAIMVDRVLANGTRKPSEAEPRRYRHRKGSLRNELNQPGDQGLTWSPRCRPAPTGGTGMPWLQATKAHDFAVARAHSLGREASRSRPLLGREHQTDGCEQRDTFDERRENQGVALDRVSRFGLAGDALTSRTTDPTDTETRPDGREASGETCTDAETGVEATSLATSWKRASIGFSVTY